MSARPQLWNRIAVRALAVALAACLMPACDDSSTDTGGVDDIEVECGDPAESDDVAAIEITIPSEDACKRLFDNPSESPCGLCTITFDNDSLLDVEYVGQSRIGGSKTLETNEVVPDDERATIPLEAECDVSWVEGGSYRVSVYEDPDGVPDNAVRGPLVCEKDIEYRVEVRFF